MTESEARQVRLSLLGGASVISLYRGLLYFLSFLGPVLVVARLRFLPTPALLAMAIVGVRVAGVAFLCLLVLTKKALVGPLRETGLYTMQSPYAQRWFSAAMLMVIVDNSPFRPMTTGLSLFAAWFYRGMGARIPSSALMGIRARIVDPWFLEMGENVNVGADAVILGHLGHGKEIVLGRVSIGDGAIIGTRSTILPDVHIGSHATVAAGALVVRGTVIPDGEAWGGVPARRLSAKA